MIDQSHYGQQRLTSMGPSSSNAYDMRKIVTWNINRINGFKMVVVAVQLKTCPFCTCIDVVHIYKGVEHQL